MKKNLSANTTSNMRKTFRSSLNTIGKASAALAVSALFATAMAQTSTSGSNTSSSGYSMMAPGSTYIGLNAGQSKFRNNNGLGAFPSDSKDKSFGLYGGSYFTPNFGLELGYTDLGESSRAGGKTEAKAGSVSLIGKLPLNPSFNLLAKLGGTYSQVDVSAQSNTGIATGRKSGWGPSYGVGAEYNFTENVSAVVQYDEYRMPYPGGSKEKLNNTSVGVRFKF